MKIETFALERWMTTYELDVEYDITERAASDVRSGELLPEGERMGFSTSCRYLARLQRGAGTSSCEAVVVLAATYAGSTPWTNVLVTTGAIEANFFVLFNVLLEAGDHVTGSIRPTSNSQRSEGIEGDVDLEADA
ncbi:MAG: hypothetical protein R3A46_01765 [Thermomicrobiales bacterium]